MSFIWAHHAVLTTARSLAVGGSTTGSRALLDRSTAPRTTTAVIRSLSYYAEKQKRKEKRIAHWNIRKARQEKLPTRRANNENIWRKEFRDFFIRKKVHEQYMNRKARQAGLGWNMQIAVLLERQNIVMPDNPDWLVEMEILQAHLSKFGKMYPKEIWGNEWKPDEDPEEFLENAPITEEELLKLLPEGFVPAPRETPADESGDVRTTERKLKTSVYLAVQPEENKDWQFPTVTLQEDETVLEAGKRALASLIGPEVEFWTPSNAPVAVDMVAIPEEERPKQSIWGTKTFFMKFVHMEGQVEPSSMKVKDYAWLDRGEMTERIRDQQGDYMAKFYHYLL